MPMQTKAVDFDVKRLCTRELHWLKLLSQETVVSEHSRPESPAKAARAHAEARTQAKAAQAQAELAEAEAKVAKDQAAAIARALQEDEASRQADLHEVAEKEAEAAPEWPPDG